MIPFVDLKSEYCNIKNEIDVAIKNVIANGSFILGDCNNKFETEFSGYIGSKYAISVNSGSDALFLAVNALGIGHGDEVITVSHTFISTVDAIVKNDAKPVFVDINPDTYCIDENKIEEKITKKTKAILPVHLYGQTANMSIIKEIADKYGLYIIEDACQAHGAEHYGKKAGSFGDVSCFSFYPTKNVGSYGDGGIILTDNESIAEKLRMLRNYGQQKKYYHEFIGYNSRLDEIQAAILSVKLKHLDRWNNRRREIATLYDELLLGPKVIVPIEKSYNKHIYYVYVIRIKKRDSLQRYLTDRGIQTQIHYPIPIHKQNAYLNLGYKLNLPVTENASKKVLSLPMYPYLSDKAIISISEKINQF